MQTWINPRDGEYRVLRGGSWINTAPAEFRCANRNYIDPAFRYFTVGFRCVIPTPSEMQSLL